MFCGQIIFKQMQLNLYLELVCRGQHVVTQVLRVGERKECIMNYKFSHNLFNSCVTVT